MSNASNPQPAAAPTTALAAPEKRPLTVEERIQNLNGTFTAVEKLNDRLRFAQQHCHLVGGLSASKLPEGCAVAMGIVRVEPDVDAHDVGMGKYSILSHALYKLAAAAGIAFDPNASGRVDDGRDPHFCKWRAVGARRDLDGSVIPLVREKIMDLREGSPTVEKMKKEARDDVSFQKNLRMQRAFIEAHAQTKAEQRVIRKLLGLRSYTKGELDKPFAIVKLQFTGHSDDPEIRRANAAAIRDSMLGGVQALFGPPRSAVAPVAPLPAATSPAVPRALPAPPVGTVSDDDDDLDAPTAHGAPQTSTSPGAAAPTAPAAKAQAPARPAAGSKFSFGKGKGKTVGEVDDEQLEWYAGAIKASVEDPSKTQYLDRNKALLAEVLAEMEKRAGVPSDAGSAPKDGAPSGEIDRGDDPENY